MLNRRINSLRQTASVKLLSGYSSLEGVFQLGPKEPKLFCIGMQRSGTTSTGDFCESELRLRRRGYKISNTRGWTRAWYEGRLQDVFDDPVFRSGEVFDDDPWWCPSVYKILAERFETTKFVIFTRPADEWFRSLASHSGGRSPGFTDIHAKIYGRERDFERVKGNSYREEDYKWNGLCLSGFEQHYMDVYLRYISGVHNFFKKNAPDRLLSLRLSDSEKFKKLAVFLGYPEREYPDFGAKRVTSNIL